LVGGVAQISLPEKDIETAIDSLRLYSMKTRPKLTLQNSSIETGLLLLERLIIG
jgi:hypothetical protein